MKRFISLLLASVALTACVDTSNPQNTMGSALSAIQNGNVEEFRQTLAETQEETYGNPAAMSDLKGVLSKYSSITTGGEYMTDHLYGNQGQGYWGDILRSYSETVYGMNDKGERVDIFALQVVCLIHTVEGAPVPHPGCESEQVNEQCEGFPKASLEQDCRISDIQRLSNSY